MKYFLVKVLRENFIISYINLVKFFTKINKKRIVLHQPFKFGYDCNQKYIAEEILRQKLPYEIIWITRDSRIDSGRFPEKIKVVAEKDILKTLFYIHTAKFCITNAFFPYQNFIKKRKKQIYMNTWHGSLGIKRIGLSKNFAIETNKDFTSKKFNFVDIFISNSSFETNVYQNSLLFNNKIIEIGHPRNDILIDKILSNEEKTEIEKKIRKFSDYNIPLDTKLVLYAPTFRNTSSLKYFNMDYELLLETLKEKYNEKFVLLLRLHPTIKDVFGHYIIKNEQVFDYTKYDDIQELMLISDIMVTDYSSCIFDFMLTRKPGFIYASDIEEYDQVRGFYYPLESTPFPIIKNNNELKDKILSFDYPKYKEKLEKFLKEKGCIEDGHASYKVVEIIKNGEV